MGLFLVDLEIVVLLRIFVGGPVLLVSLLASFLPPSFSTIPTIRLSLLFLLILAFFHLSLPRIIAVLPVIVVMIPRVSVIKFVD